MSRSHWLLGTAPACFGERSHAKAQGWHDGHPEDFPPTSVCPLRNELRKCYFSFLFHLGCAKGTVGCSIIYPWLEGVKFTAFFETVQHFYVSCGFP